MSEYSKIVFFNGHQHGDIANSRGIVNYITNKLGELFQYFFVHQKHPDSILFNESVKIYNDTETYQKMFPYPILGNIHTSHIFRTHYTIDDMIFLNLWVGCSKSFNQDIEKYGTGITRKSLHHVALECIDYIKSESGVEIPYPLEHEVLPKSIPNPKNKELVQTFISNHLSKYRKSVLIPNGKMMSSQAPQFNFGGQIKNLIQLNKDVAFIFTEKNFEQFEDNIYFVDDLFPIPNLNEIDYLSRSCDILITRGSGPGCLISTWDNYKDNTKTFISFTSDPSIAFEGLSSYEEIIERKWNSNGGAKMIWSNDFSSENLCKIIGDVIK